MNDAPSSSPVSRDELFSPLLPREGSARVRWRISRTPVAYPDALAEMDALAEAIATGREDETVWLLEHPALYTAGTSANPSDLVQPERFPIFQTGRGGQFTYHGPGQRVAYVMLDLKRRTQDVRLYVASLEEWLIRVLASFNVRGERREDRVGVWVRQPASVGDGEDKIAALGIRVRRWVTMHGISLNVEPDLSHFDGIVPCGVREHGVTSLVRLGLPLTIDDVDLALRREFEGIFGPTRLDEREA